MLDQFESWLREIEKYALARKHAESSQKYSGNESHWKRFIWKSPTKNKEIKQRFVSEAPDKYEARASGAFGKSEWLYDLVWREFDERGNFVRLILAMEIELSAWSHSALKYDLNKLLQANADYKIFIFQQKTELDCISFIAKAKEAITAYNGTDDQYLIAAWWVQENTFLFEQIIAT